MIPWIYSVWIVVGWSTPEIYAFMDSPKGLNRIDHHNRICSWSRGILYNCSLHFFGFFGCLATFFIFCIFCYWIVGGTGLIKPKSRLHLWQVFFYNPDEWWDNRKRKKKPSQPDFEHKHTGEALWLHKGDPVWVRKQLQLHDSRMAELDQVRPTGIRAVSPMQL